MATKTTSAALAELAELGSSLATVAEDKAKQEETLTKILDTIGELDKDTAKELFKDPQVQRLIELASGELAEARDDRPGSIATGPDGKPFPFAQKTPWSEAHLNKLIESGEMEVIRNYRPLTTKYIGYNGLERHFVARQPITCPKCFVDVYEEHLNAEEVAEQHVAFLFRKRDTLSDRSLLTEGGLRARGAGDKGHYVPGGGNVAMGDTEGGE